MTTNRLTETFCVPMHLISPSGDRTETVDAVADTGASLSQVPASVLDKLGIVPTDTVRIEQADGQTIKRNAAEAIVRVGDSKTVTWVVFGPENAPPLLGSYTLAGLRLAVDPAAQRLIPSILRRIEHTVLVPTPQKSTPKASNNMGTFNWPMEIAPLDGARYQTVSAIVDTGASFSQIPASLLRQLGIVPTRTVETELADGTTAQAHLGDLKIRINGREAYSTVLFGEEGSPILMGAYALEGVVLAADPSNRRLIDLKVTR